MQQQSLIGKRRIYRPVTKIQCFIRLIIFVILLSAFYNNLTLKWEFENFPLIDWTGSTRSSRSTTHLLLLYEEQLARVEKAPFRPMFHNHQLTLKLNLITMAIDFFDYLKSNSTSTIHQLKVIALQGSKNVNDSHPICEINLTFCAEMLNTEKVRLIFLLEKANCSLSLTNTSDMISIAIHRRFSADDIFSFTHQWLGFDRAELSFWPEWPITRKCLDNYLNNLLGNAKEFSKLNLNASQCSLVSVLTHSTSRELFTEEQNAVSYWLDLQSKESIDQINESMNIRRLAPFEIAKNPAVCSKKFQEWIWKYQQWHENITFLLDNGSMTFEEQRKRIIELDIRFLIYEREDTGIADRIVHLISTYLVALLTNRLLIFDANWPDFLNAIQSSLNYEQQLVIPWISQLNLLNKNLPLDDTNYLKLKRHNFSLERFKTDYDYEKTFPERILVFKGHTGNVIRTIESNSSIYRRFLIDDLKMNTNQIFGCLYHSLFAYRLSQLIKRVPLTSTNEQLGHSSQQILKTLLSPKIFPTGIQIRAGDKTMNEKDIDQSNLNNFISFFKCAQDLIKKNQLMFNKTGQKGISFLLSDSAQIRQTALRRWQLPLQCFQSFEDQCQGDNGSFYILANSKSVLHIQITKNLTLGFQLGMFDAFLFSLCEQHIISTESGFGRFPAFASLKQRNIYSFFPHEKHSCRDEGLSLAKSGYHWSGI